MKEMNFLNWKCFKEKVLILQLKTFRGGQYLEVGPNDMEPEISYEKLAP